MSAPFKTGREAWTTALVSPGTFNDCALNSIPTVSIGWLGQLQTVTHTCTHQGQSRAHAQPIAHRHAPTRPAMLA